MLPPARCWEGHHWRKQEQFVAVLGKPGLSPGSQGKGQLASAHANSQRSDNLSFYIPLGSVKEMLTSSLPWCLVSNLLAAWVYERFYGAEACVRFCPWQRETAAGICCSDTHSSSEGRKRKRIPINFLP